MIKLIGIFTLTRLSQYQKARSSITFTPYGISILVRLVQDSNIPLAIFFIPLGMFTLVKSSQPQKAYAPMEVTLSGIFILLRLEQP